MSNANAHPPGSHAVPPVGAEHAPTALPVHPVPGAATELHEGSDPNLRPIVGFAIALTVLSIVALVLMRALFVAEIDTQRANDPPLTPLTSERQVPPEPRLQSLPGVPLSGALSAGEVPEGADPFQTSSTTGFESKARATLDSYGWVDRQAGIVHVPIERAIDLVLKNGLPTSLPKSDKR